MKRFAILAFIVAIPLLAFAGNETAEDPKPYTIPEHALMGMAAAACPYPDAKVSTCFNMAQDFEEENMAVALGLKVKASEHVHIKFTGATTEEEMAASIGVGIKLW